jgi:hypothetical protein
VATSSNLLQIILQNHSRSLSCTILGLPEIPAINHIKQLEITAYLWDDQLEITD